MKLEKLLIEKENIELKIQKERNSIAKKSCPYKIGQNIRFRICRIDWLPTIVEGTIINIFGINPKYTENKYNPKWELELNVFKTYPISNDKWPSPEIKLGKQKFINDTWDIYSSYELI